MIMVLQAVSQMINMADRASRGRTSQLHSPMANLRTDMQTLGRTIASFCSSWRHSNGASEEEKPPTKSTIRTEMITIENLGIFSRFRFRNGTGK